LVKSKTRKSNEMSEEPKKFYEYALLISGAENVEEMTKNTFEAITTMIRPDSINFGTVHFGVLRGTSYRPQEGSMTPLRMILPLDGPGIMVRAIRTKKTCNVPDTRKDQDYVSSRSSDGEGHTLSELAVPIITHGKAMGVLNIENDDLDAYTMEDQETLEALAGFAGLALSRLRYDDSLRSLHDYASRLVSARNVSEIADYTLDAMVNTLELEFCEFSLVQDGVPTSISVKGLDETMQLREKALERSREQVLILKKSMTIQSRYIYELGDLEFLTELEVPVMVDGEVVASLSAKSIRPDAYSEQDRELLETLASHVGVAMARIRVKESVKTLAYRLNNLELGGCYISDSHERCLKAYAVLSMEEVPGLCIVREDPQRLVDNYGIKKEEIALLSSRPFEDYETLKDLQLVSRAISRFLESGEGVVLLDGLEYLISRFGFDAVYSFVQEKRFDFLTSKAVLLVPLEMKTLDERQLAMLTSEFTLLE
jgi:GAF domain-containing protein